MTGLSPKTFPPNDNNFSPMTEPINAGRRQEGIAKEARPLGWGTIGSQQDAAAFIALIDDVIQIGWGWGLEGLEAKIVEDQ